MEPYDDADAYDDACYDDGDYDPTDVVVSAQRPKTKPKAKAPVAAAAPAQPRQPDSRPRTAAAKLAPSDEVFGRLTWTVPAEHHGRVEVGYEDRFAGLLYMPLRRFRDVTAGDAIGSDPGAAGSTIPFHRVQTFRVFGVVVWDRQAKLDRLASVAAIVEGGASDGLVADPRAEASQRLENLGKAFAANHIAPLGDTSVATGRVRAAVAVTGGAATIDVTLSAVFSTDIGVAVGVVRSTITAARNHGALFPGAESLTISLVPVAGGGPRAFGVALDGSTARAADAIAFTELLFALRTAVGQPPSSSTQLGEHARVAVAGPSSTAAENAACVLEVVGFDIVATDGSLLYACDLSGGCRAARDSSIRQAMPAVTEPDNTGRPLRPYVPADALERWLCANSDGTRALANPTHISQLGGMYSVPSKARDGFIAAWKRAIAESSSTPFYVEEVRSPLFRMYVDVDMLLASPESPTDAYLLDLTAQVAARVAAALNISAGDAARRAVAFKCHGPWEDASPEHLAVKAKCGLRIYFPGTSVDEAGHAAATEALAAALEADEFPLPAALVVRAGQTAWREMLDVEHATWDRARLVGTHKRRRVRHLDRRYVSFCRVDGSGAAALDREIDPAETLVRIEEAVAAV